MNSQNKWLVFLAVGIMILLVNLDTTIVNLALASIAREFKVGMKHIQWVITSYLLVTAVTFCIFGRLADMLGKRNVYLLGVSFFIIASLLAGLAPNVNVLIAARFIQGLGFAATLGLSLILIVSAFPEQQRGFAMGAAITITGVAQAIGPIVGGIILEFASWRWIFLINIPLGILSIIMTIKTLPREEIETKLRMDVWGSMLFIAGFSFILVSVNQYTVLDKYLLVLFIVVGIGLLAGFVIRSLNTPYPLVDIRLFKNGQYLILIIFRMLFMFVSNGLLFLIPLYLQNIVGLSAIRTGVFLLFMTAMIAIFSPLTGRITDVIGYKWPIMVSMLCALVSSFLLTQLGSGGDHYVLMVALLLFGLAFGANITATAVGVIQQAPKESVGVAMGLFFTIAIGSAMLGVAISSAIMNLHSRALLESYLSVQHVHVGSDQLLLLLQAANGSQNQSAVIAGLASVQPDLRSLRGVLGDAFFSAFHRVFYVMMALSVIGLVLSLLALRFPKEHDKYDGGSER